MSKQKNNFSYEYLAGLILPFILIFLVSEDSDNGIFAFSAIILAFNLFLFIKVRCGAIQLFGNLIISSLALTMSIWLFLHCLFVKYTACQEFIIWLTRHNKGMAVFNSGAFAFFMAFLVLFVVAIIEVFSTKRKQLKIINYIFIGGSCVVLSIYVLIFPNIIISRPTIKQKSPTDKELIISEKRFGELFIDGQLIKGYKAEKTN